MKKLMVLLAGIGLGLILVAGGSEEVEEGQRVAEVSDLCYGS